MSGIAPYGVECDVPLGTLHTGSNSLVFSMAQSGAGAMTAMGGWCGCS